MTNKFRDALELFPRTGSSVETLGRFQFDFTNTIKQALTIAAALQDEAETLRGLEIAGRYAANAHPAIKKIVETMGGLKDDR